MSLSLTYKVVASFRIPNCIEFGTIKYGCQNTVGSVLASRW